MQAAIFDTWSGCGVQAAKKTRHAQRGQRLTCAAAPAAAGASQSADLGPILNVCLGLVVTSCNPGVSVQIPSANGPWTSTATSVSWPILTLARYAHPDHLPHALLHLLQLS